MGPFECWMRSADEGFFRCRRTRYVLTCWCSSRGIKLLRGLPKTVIKLCNSLLIGQFGYDYPFSARPIVTIFQAPISVHFTIMCKKKIICN